MQDTGGEAGTSDVFLWTPSTYGQAKAGQPARTYIQQLVGQTRFFSLGEATSLGEGN